MSSKVNSIVVDNQAIHICTICGRKYLVRRSAVNHVKRKHKDKLHGFTGKQ
ncbi:MAG: hypothetical protein QXV82_09275 [Ignisphaera sp.]